MRHYKRYGRKPIRRFGRRKSYAGRIAGRVARKTYKGTRRMSKTRVRKIYANKSGQTAYRAVRKLRGRKSYGRRTKRYGRRFKRRY